jgi:hypothetical protein
MSRLKDLIPGPPVHQRKIEIRTVPLDNGQIIVEGWLTDNRLLAGYHWDGRPRPPGVVHRIGVRLLVGDWPPAIQEAEAEMVDIPHELCPTVADSIQKIVGVSVAAGFSEQIRRRLGGVEGCSHLTHLLLAMGPAILHGFWAQHSRKPRPLPRTKEEVQGLPYLINSCQLWRENGPLLQLVDETIERLNREPGKPDNGGEDESL